MTDRSITAELVTELPKYAKAAKESRPKEVYVASWTLGGQCRNPRQREVSRLLTEVGEEGPYSYGEDHGRGRVNGHSDGEIAGGHDNVGAESQRWNITSGGRG